MNGKRSGNHVERVLRKWKESHVAVNKVDSVRNTQPTCILKTVPPTGALLVSSTPEVNSNSFAA